MEKSTKSVHKSVQQHDDLRRSAAQWVRCGAHSWQSKLIANIGLGGSGFESHMGRWIFSSMSMIPVSGQAVGVFLQALKFAPLPQLPSNNQNKNLIPNSVILAKCDRCRALGF